MSSSPTSTAVAITGATAGPPRFSNPLTIVTVIIGRTVPKTFPIYKEFACYYSPVLRDAFNGPFLEGQSQTMIIDDFSPSGAFGFVLHWMYTGRLQKDETANHITQDIIKHSNIGDISTKDITWTYRNTAPDSMLRKRIVDVCAFRRMDAAWLQDGKEEEFPPRFLLDVALAMRKGRKTTSQVHQDASKVITKTLKVEDYMVPGPELTA
ncbi:hypothetical protein BKA65DRAFT_591659 [Rhexocercosporidium sp. MPI-PUGE-AT-0058]|nr:hypothetical protein BKA65DRAFT_591659 [Rhexocercosporidium sp. MPI-PUGE-AT-0058]